MNKFSPRVRAYIFAGIAILALILLSASLNSLEMSPGKPFGFYQIAPRLVDTGTSSDTMRILLAIFRVMMILGWVLLPIYIIMLFISKEERKRFLRSLAYILPFLLLLFFLMNNQMSRQAAEDLSPRMFGSENGTVGLPTSIPPPVFVPPPQWVTTLTAVALALVIALILVGIVYTLWRQSQARERLRAPLKRVEREAQSALDAIRAGGDLREAVLRCYVQMIEALREYRGIYRDQDMTPHEFELFLEKRGVPIDPVRQLTRLFEDVRYGTMKPGRREEETAITSLSAIVSACQRAAERRAAEHPVVERQG